MRALAVAILLTLTSAKSIFAWTKQKPRIPALVLTYDDRRPLARFVIRQYEMQFFCES